LAPLLAGLTVVTLAVLAARHRVERPQLDTQGNPNAGSHRRTRAGTAIRRGTLAVQDRRPGFAAEPRRMSVRRFTDAQHYLRVRSSR
jgi:hypothetical protein